MNTQDTLKGKSLGFFANLIIVIVLFVLFGCSKQDGPTGEEEVIEPIEISTGAHLNLTQSSVTLMADVNKLNNEEVLDHGFIWFTVTTEGAKSEEKYLSMGRTIKEGGLKYEFNLPTGFKSGVTYQYFFFVRTKQNFYKGSVYSFLTNAVSIDQLGDIFSYGIDTITLTGDFQSMGDGYRIETTGAFNSFSVPFELDANKKKLRFVVAGNPSVLHSSSIAVSLVKRGNNEFNYRRNIAKITYLAKFDAPSFDRSSLYNSVIFNQTNTNYVAQLYHSGNIKLLINDIVVPFNTHIYLLDYGKLSGTSFKFGIDDGSKVYMFPDSIHLHPGAQAQMVANTYLIHPNSEFRVTGHNLMTYFPRASFQLGDKNFDATVDYDTRSVSRYFTNAPIGEFDVRLVNNFYQLKLPKKLKVEELYVTSVNKRNGYVGEHIEFTGNFIPGKHYSVFNENDKYVGSVDCSVVNKLHIQVNNWCIGMKGFKVGYSKSPDGVFIANKVLPFNCDGFTFDRFYPNKGGSGTILTIEGIGIAFAEKFLLADEELKPIRINDNKVSFSLPQMSGRGKMRINYYMNSKMYQSSEYFEFI